MELSWSERSLKIFPAGSNGEFNLPPELSTVIHRGRGSEIWDAEGRRFLDFSMGWGSVLAGHARAEIVEAVQSRAALGSNFACVNDEALLLAEELCRLSPACEQVRFCASGTEATFYCLRLARAWTRRAKVLKFEGAYHGAHDLGVASLFPDQPPDYPRPQPSSAGLEMPRQDNVLVAPYNDIEATAEILRRHAGELAAVIIEPLQRCISPRPGFLEALRELTRELSVILIFDEVVTGFRLAYGGAQEYYRVVPDLVAYGKALGGGYPIGAFGGPEKILSLAREDRLGRDDHVWTASTLGGNPISCAAARAALRMLAQPGVYERLHHSGHYLRAGMRRILQQRGLEAQVIGDGPLAQAVFTSQEVRDYRSHRLGDRRLARDLALGLFRRGIFLNPMGTKLYLSLAHDDRSCDEFLSRFEETIAEDLRGG